VKKNIEDLPSAFIKQLTTRFSSYSTYTQGLACEVSQFRPQSNNMERRSIVIDFHKFSDCMVNFTRLFLGTTCKDLKSFGLPSEYIQSLEYEINNYPGKQFCKVLPFPFLSCFSLLFYMFDQ
jgi:hypothetical protein